MPKTRPRRAAAWQGHETARGTLATEPTDGEGARVVDVYVALLEPNERIAEKLASKHGVSWHEVEEVVLFPAVPISVKWQGPVPGDDRSPRALVRGRTAAGRILEVVLYPAVEAAFEGTWRVATAVPWP